VPSYRIVTLGCKLNQADSAALEARLRALGLTRAGDAAARDGAPAIGGAPTSADLVVLNTCTVTGGADREARQIARRLRRANPRARLIVTGCYAERDGRALAALPGVDHVVGMRDQAGRVEALARAALGITPPPGAAPCLPPGPPSDGGIDLGRFGATLACDPAEGDRTRAYLKIQDGCDLRCSYCVIPSVRGGSRSLPPDNVLRRIEALSGAGYREIVFTGVNTGDYGKDLAPPLRLHDLLAHALALPGAGRLRLNSLEPRTITSETIDLLAGSGGRLARHLQVPLQSGSDAVLGRMRRNYRTADYARVVGRLREAIPGIGLGADVIAGFPGETDAEFEATCRFIEASPLNYLHVFSYSARPGTPAATMPGAVPPAVVRERSARLRALGRTLSLRFRRSFVGRDLPVLVLREIRPDGRLRALSDNFIDVGLDPGDRPAGDLFNRLIAARISAATEDDTLAQAA
jgi:threonylcarbamoyladenosine tRNA methylthiotransferase MtaB